MNIVVLANANAHLFTKKFMDWLPDNVHVWLAFEREAEKIVSRGFNHYSARTIIHVLRHHSAIAEVGGEWKINNDISPYLARLWALTHPAYANLFEYRTVHVRSVA